MATYTVTTLDDSMDPNDGKLSLREALNAANATAAADTITFASALEGKTLLLSGGQLQIASNVTLSGDPDHDRTGITIDAGGGSRVIEVTGAGTSAALDGLVLKNGYVSDGDGGGIYLDDNCHLSITNSKVDGNSVLNYPETLGVGGNIFAGEGSHLDIQNSTISHGFAFSAGGGIFASNAVVTIVNSNIEANRATGSIHYESRGGGMYVSGSLAITNSSVVSNTAGFGGGLNFSGDLSVTNSTFAKNFADGYYQYGGRGGAIEANGNISITSSTITSNECWVGYQDYEYWLGSGGGLSLSGQVALSNSIVTGNSIYGENYLKRSDIAGLIDVSNGHNILGAVTGGAVEGDAVDADPARIFAYLDPNWDGGGQVVMTNGVWIAPLLDDAHNPALSGADPATAGTVDERGAARPSPGDSLPDIGAYELTQTHQSHVATNWNDVLTGTSANNTIDGSGGADLIKGLGGNDVLKGGWGSDVLDGGDGNDRLEGSRGADTLIGGAGIDTVDYSQSAAGVTVDLVARTGRDGTAVDTIRQIEDVLGSAFNDRLTGDGLANRLTGGAGADGLTGNGGADVLVGGLGKDTSAGGGGNDLFDFDTAADSVAGANADWITDFTGVGAAVGDRIDLADVYAGTLSFKGTAAFNHAGQVRVVASGSDTIVQVNLTGTSGAEMEIHVQDGSATPSQWVAGDFIL